MTKLGVIWASALACLVVAVAQRNKLLVEIAKAKAAKSLELSNSIDDQVPGIPGRAGTDYPLWKEAPDTSFRCRDYDYAGYFADIETGCQVYRVCFPDHRNASFICPNGTVFNQRYFVCDWWFNFNCSHAPSLYNLNLFRRPPLPVLGPAPPFRLSNKRQVTVLEPTLVRTVPKVVVPKISMVQDKAKTQKSDCHCPCMTKNSTIRF